MRVSIQDFLKVAAAYQKALKLAETTASVRIFNDWRRLGLIRDGGDIWHRGLVEKMRWFKKNWPEGVAWPKGVPEPVEAKRGPKQNKAGRRKAVRDRKTA